MSVYGWMTTKQSPLVTHASRQEATSASVEQPSLSEAQSASTKATPTAASVREKPRTNFSKDEHVTKTHAVFGRKRMLRR